jgi:nitrogen permease regulator 3-like protein
LHSFQGDNDDYEWKRPNAIATARDRSVSHSTTHPASGRNSPSGDDSYDIENHAIKDHYDDLFGYSSEFLAGLLCPHGSLCHQKFELLVDDLAFIGHPVCAEADGVWKFKPERSKANMRGRGSRNRELSQVDETSPGSREGSPSVERPSATKSAWLQTFHFVIVLDMPDPSSSASGNISKYFDIIYEQIAFTVTAVLFQEQVVSNFVEVECDALGTLKDECIAKGSSLTRCYCLN